MPGPNRPSDRQLQIAKKLSKRYANTSARLWRAKTGTAPPYSKKGVRKTAINRFFDRGPDYKDNLNYRQELGQLRKNIRKNKVLTRYYKGRRG